MANVKPTHPRSLRLKASHSLVPSLVFWSSHERLPVVRVRLAPAKDPGRRIQLAGGASSFNRAQAGDQLLVKISAFRQGQTANPIEGFPPEREAGVESACGVFPNNQNISLCQAGKSVEFLRQLAETT